MKYLERVANIAVIVGVVVFLGVVIRGEFFQHKPTDTSAKALLGKTITLPGIHFSQQRDSLVIAVSTTCHFCKDSLPFYKDLAAKSLGRVDVVAVLPQSQPESQAFLQQAGVAATQVVSANLDTIGVNGTPTVLLVDGSGKVKGAWVGRLDEKGQLDLLSQALPKSSS